MRRFIAAVLGAVPTETEPAICVVCCSSWRGPVSFLPGKCPRRIARPSRQPLPFPAARSPSPATRTRGVLRARSSFEFAARADSTGHGAPSLRRQPRHCPRRARRAPAARASLTSRRSSPARADSSGRLPVWLSRLSPPLPEETTRSRVWASVMHQILSNDYARRDPRGPQASSWEGASSQPRPWRVC